MKTSFIAPFIAILVTALCLSACNTFSGMGKDIEAGGKAITNAANHDSSPPKKTTTLHSTNQATGTQTTITTTTPAQ